MKQLYTLLIIGLCLTFSAELSAQEGNMVNFNNNTDAGEVFKGVSQNIYPIEDPFYVHNSGLVIMAPYFNRYFGMLDMLENGVFRDESTAIRAVFLLEYLASGRTEVAEHELVFNKVLCGLTINTLVPESIELTEEEVEVSHQMFNAILQNWPGMDSLTAEKLQQSFILRQGLLLEQEDRWSLNVESKDYDVLLNYLPWMMSVVELPWMAKEIEISWDIQP